MPQRSEARACGGGSGHRDAAAKGQDLSCEQLISGSY